MCDPFQRVPQPLVAGQGLAAAAVGDLNLETIHAAQSGGERILRAANCLEGEEIVVVAFVDGAGETGLVGPRAYRSLVLASECDSFRLVPGVGMEVFEIKFLVGAEPVLTEVRSARPRPRRVGCRDGKEVDVGSPGHPCDGLRGLRPGFDLLIRDSVTAFIRISDLQLGIFKGILTSIHKRQFEGVADPSPSLELEVVNVLQVGDRVDGPDPGGAIGLDKSRL